MQQGEMGSTNGSDVVDAHVHLYRDLALEKQNVAIPGRRDRDRWAHPEALDAYLDGHGIAAVVALPNFPTRQMRAAQVARLPDDLPPDKAAAAREAIAFAPEGSSPVSITVGGSAPFVRHTLINVSTITV